ncbi:hypothetical protein ACEQPO_22635 [Bacillus sp. SL00103]
MIEADSNDSLYVTKVSVRWYRELIKKILMRPYINECFKTIPLLLMQAGDDKIVDKTRVIKWFNGIESTNRSHIVNGKTCITKFLMNRKEKMCLRQRRAFTDQYI